MGDGGGRQARAALLRRGAVGARTSWARVGVRFRLALSAEVAADAVLALLAFLLFARAQLPRPAHELVALAQAAEAAEAAEAAGAASAAAAGHPAPVPRGGRAAEQRELRRGRRLREALEALELAVAAAAAASADVVAIIIGGSPHSAKEVFLVRLALAPAGEGGGPGCASAHLPPATRAAVRRKMVAAAAQGAVLDRQGLPSRTHVLLRVPAGTELPGCVPRPDLSVCDLALRGDSLPVHLFDVSGGATDAPQAGDAGGAFGGRSAADASSATPSEGEPTERTGPTLRDVLGDTGVWHLWQAAQLRGHSAGA
jgi:hypothetical protein